MVTAQQCVAQRGRFTLVASGGSTPQPLYRLLATLPFAHRMPWSQTHLFWGDERCVTADHPDSNYRLVKEELLAQGLLPTANIHRMVGEIPAATGAANYEEELRNFFVSHGDEAITWPVFDLILLGLGSDGHTASLFPNSSALNEKTKWVTATPPGVLAPQVHRLTLTLPVLNNSAEVIFLVAGAKKKTLVEQIISHRQGQAEYPAGYIKPQGKLHWYIAEV